MKYMVNYEGKKDPADHQTQSLMRYATPKVGQKPRCQTRWYHRNKMLRPSKAS